MAIHLKTSDPGLQICVFEKDFPGWGASGKSGGLLVANKALPGSFEDLDYFFKFVNAFQIDADLQEGDEKLANVVDEFGDPLINPYALVCEMVRVCESLGIKVFCRSVITNVRDHGHELISPFVTIYADVCLLATDGFTSLLPQCDQAAVELSAQRCIAVEVSGDSIMQIPWVYFRPLDASGNYLWGRRLGKSRFLFGSEEIPWDAGEIDTAGTNEDLVQVARNRLPQLGSLTVLNGWTGRIARFRDAPGRRVSKLSRTDSLYSIGGYAGIGLTAAVRSGLVVTDILRGGMGTSDFPLINSS